MEISFASVNFDPVCEHFSRHVISKPTIPGQVKLDDGFCILQTSNCCLLVMANVHVSLLDLLH